MLTAYQTAVQNLLQLPGAPTSLYGTSSLNLWINNARGQLAGEAECIRAIGTLTATVGLRAYSFSQIDIGTPSITGVQGIMHVRRLQYGVGSGQKWVNNKAWEWFDYFRLNNPAPPSGPPTMWAQYGQGSSGQGSITGEGSGSLVSGSLYIDPPPDLAYTIYCDCVCYPIALAADTDVEAIPYIFTDAVAYFAAYLALMSAQTGQRLQQAQQMKQLYGEFAQRGRAASTSAVNRYLYEQVPDPTMANQMALSSGGQSGQ